MKSTVLAGPLEFSAGDIALVLALVACAFVTVMAPGWGVVALAALASWGACWGLAHWLSPGTLSRAALLPGRDRKASDEGWGR
jgi:hypothetical protein